MIHRVPFCLCCSKIIIIQPLSIFLCQLLPSLSSHSLPSYLPGGRRDLSVLERHKCLCLQSVFESPKGRHESAWGLYVCLLGCQLPTPSSVREKSCAVHWKKRVVEDSYQWNLEGTGERRQKGRIDNFARPNWRRGHQPAFPWLPFYGKCLNQQSSYIYACCSWAALKPSCCVTPFKGSAGEHRFPMECWTLSAFTGKLSSATKDVMMIHYVVLTPISFAQPDTLSICISGWGSVWWVHFAFRPKVED